jgi:hypothetical protein
LAASLPPINRKDPLEQPRSLEFFLRRGHRARTRLRFRPVSSMGSSSSSLSAPSLFLPCVCPFYLR